MATPQYDPLFEYVLYNDIMYELILYILKIIPKESYQRVFYNKKYMYMKNIYKPTISDSKQWYLPLYATNLIERFFFFENMKND